MTAPLVELEDENAMVEVVDDNTVPSTRAASKEPSPFLSPPVQLSKITVRVAAPCGSQLHEGSVDKNSSSLVNDRLYFAELAKRLIANSDPKIKWHLTRDDGSRVDMKTWYGPRGNNESYQLHLTTPLFTASKRQPPRKEHDSSLFFSTNNIYDTTRYKEMLVQPGAWVCLPSYVMLKILPHALEHKTKHVLFHEDTKLRVLTEFFGAGAKILFLRNSWDETPIITSPETKELLSQSLSSLGVQNGGILMMQVPVVD